MRVWGWAVLVFWLPGRLLAAPEPPPPGDYPGAQYIDGHGCVFYRDGVDWQARFDRDGQPVCGFPPSLAAEAPVPSEPPPSPEEILTAALAQGLRAGDLASDAPVPAPLDLPPDPAQAALRDAVAQEIVLDERLRSLTGPAAPAGLCARLGYRAPAGGETASGDVTNGMCPGMVVTSPGPVVAAAARLQPPAPSSPETAKRAENGAHREVAPPAIAESSGWSRTPARPAAPAAPAATRKASTGSARPTKPRTVAAPAPASTGEMIAPGARYVRVAVHADPAAAAAAAAALSRAGYPVAMMAEAVAGNPGQAVLAGPFADRQALVRALDRLRNNGYPGAVAR